MRETAIDLETGETLEIADSKIVEGEYAIKCINSKGKVLIKKRSQLIYKIDVEHLNYLKSVKKESLTERGQRFYDIKLQRLCNRLNLSPIEIFNLNIGAKV